MRKSIAAIIPIKGMIVSGDSAPSGPIPFLPLGGGNITFSDEIIKYLNRIERERRVRAIIFEIDSPGGTPYASKEIADAVKKLGKPAVAQIREHGTSGAYWIASACKKIIADPLSTIGGVGTRADRLDLSELAKKIGIRVDTFAQGEYKDIGSPYSEMSQKEKKFIEHHVQSFNNYFIKEIKNNRKLSDEKLLEDITSGKAFLGEEALKLGLIDYLGGSQKALEVAEQAAGAKLVYGCRKEKTEKSGLLLRMLKRLFQM